ncbi:MAG: NfeD family protein [Porphyromonadaceae bacterium]|nr:NfeD family protein [Porphyromonadaceae bacterium]
MNELDLFASWQLWLIVGIGLLILEIVTAGFLLACFGIGALGAAIVAILDLGLAWQLAAFSIISLLSLFLLRPVMMRRLERGSIPTGVDALVGRQVRLKSPISDTADYGEISIDGDVWRARVEGGISLAQGTWVEVVSVDGLILTIRPI